MPFMSTMPTAPPEPDDLLTTAEVAALARVDISTVARWARDGQLLPAQKTPGGHRRFRRSDVLAALDPKPVA